MQQNFKDNKQEGKEEKQILQEQADQFRQCIYLNGKIYETAEIEGKIHVYV